MKKLTVSSVFNERTLLYAALLYNIWLLCSVRFYPSMDGAGHLYNSKLIGHLLSGDTPSINLFFTFNHSIVPNWFSHLILSSCELVMPAWVAEKVLLILYLVGLTLSFRWLIYELCPGNLSVSIIMLPFAYSLLFHMGFYNNCISFALLFLTLAYWYRKRNTGSFSKTAMLLVLLTLTYFTAFLAFAFTGLFLGLLVLAIAIQDYSDGVALSLVMKKTWREIRILLIAALPGIVLAILFIKSTRFSSDLGRFPADELVKWLNDVRCLIVYQYKQEGNLTVQFLHLLIVMLSVALFKRFHPANKGDRSRRFQPSDVFLIPLVLTLILYFITPNDAVAGMMSDRYCLQFYMFFILWVCSQPIPPRLGAVLGILIVIIHINLLQMQQNGAIKDLDKDATTLAEASKIFEANSVVLPVNMADNWLEVHFSNYLGLEKPLVVLENYEATVGWFPVRWTDDQLPRVFLGEYDHLPSYRWTSNFASPRNISIDYVCLYGTVARINDTQWAELKAVLDKSYRHVYLSDNHYVSIYRKL